MPAATATKDQRELVKLLYLEHGHIKASQLSGIEYDTVRQWASRYGWTQKREQSLSQTVTKRITDAVQSELSENEKETRLSLSRYARRASRDAEEASLREAPYVKQVADVAGKVHKWDQQAPGTVFSLNVLNLSMLDDSDD